MKCIYLDTWETRLYVDGRRGSHVHEGEPEGLRNIVSGLIQSGPESESRVLAVGANRLWVGLCRMAKLGSQVLSRTPRATAHIIAVLVGVPASFVAGAAVFANGAGILSPERVVAVIVTYLILGAIFSFACRLIWPTATWWHWGVSISVPAVFTVGLLGRDIGAAYQSLYVFVALASACSGAFIGALPAAGLRR